MTDDEHLLHFALLATEYADYHPLAILIARRLDRIRSI
jgi:hypothetical protein